MKLPPLKFAAPRSVADACRMLADDEDAKAMAGGQSLVPLLAIRLAAPSTVVDLGRIPDLAGIDLVGDRVRIGALATHQDVISSPVVREHVPFLVDAGRHIAHTAIRNRGTIGGSIAHGDGAAEWPLALLTLSGEVEAESVRGRRRIPADELFVAPFSTALEPDEIITDVWVSTRPMRWGFGEFTRRKGDYGLAMVGVALDVEGGRCLTARVVLGAAVSTTQRSEAAETALVGAEITPDTAQAAGAAAAEAAPVISDLHGSENYRRHLIAALVERTIIEAGGRK